MDNTEIIELAAKTAHEMNNLYRAALGEQVKPAWADCSEELRASVRCGVDGIMGGNTPEKSHEGWVKFKAEHGWTYGHTEDAVAKTHPCMVAYGALPEPQKLKDTLFHSVVLGVLLRYGLLQELPELRWHKLDFRTAAGSVSGHQLYVARMRPENARVQMFRLMISFPDGKRTVERDEEGIEDMRDAQRRVEELLLSHGVKFRSTL